MKSIFVSLSAHNGTLTLEKYDGKNGVYCCVLPTEESREALANLAMQVGNENYQTAKEKLHTTVVYSEKALDSVPRFIENSYEGVCEKVDFMVGHDGDTYIAASIACPALDSLHQLLLKHGAKHSFPEYVCHVTLDKYSADEWNKREAEIKEKLAEVNRQLEESRLVVSYDTVRIANLKD